jgi:anti-sigma B factor antagonist
VEVVIDQLSDSCTVVRPSGRLDLLAAGEFKQQLVDIVSGGGRKLVVDLAGVPFIDSSGLGALVGVLKAARLAGGDLRLARAGEQAAVILKLTRLDRVFSLYASVEEATAGY